MQEKDMVNDILSMVNSSLTGYANVISQTSDHQLRQTIQQIRDNDEKFQYELYKFAKQKGYYQPAQQADQKDIQQVKSQLSGNSMSGGREMGRETSGMGSTRDMSSGIGGGSRIDW